MDLTYRDLEQYQNEGYFVARGLFPAQEAAGIREHFMARRAEGPKPGDFAGHANKGAADPLTQFPRMINMHKWDEQTERWWRDDRLAGLSRQLVGDDVVLNQTMLYFKPPGARGQAFHQDNQYIRVQPIIAAWVALDDCDAGNGQMVVVPGSHRHGILPVQRADVEQSFTNGQTTMPKGAREVGVDMRAGDVLFFGGFTIHGSYPNKTADRFRRAFIVHYRAAHTQEIAADPATSMASLKEAV